MAYNPAPLKGRRAQPKLTQSTTLPAPIGGINSQVSLAGMPADNCIYAFNMVPSEFGMRTRLGYKEHQIAVPGTGVKTIVSYEAQASANSKLFAVSNLGVYDVTVQAGTPVQDIAFGTTTGDAGYAIWTTFVNDAGAQFILLADAVNGYFIYTASTDTWAASAALTYAAGTPPDEEDIVFVMVHKERVWLVEKGTTTGWFFSLGNFSGAVEPFYFGAMFPHGGDLVGLYNWPIDAGAGTDDILVPVSRAGDVLAYQGPDPGSADTWSNIGIYYIGRTPAGRRIGAAFNGDLYLLSVFGVTSMSGLLRGISLDVQEDNIAFRISRSLRETIKLNLDELGWELKFFADEGYGVINAPEPGVSTSTQFVVNLAVKGWGFWRNVDFYTAEMWEDTAYIAKNSIVYSMESSLDNIDEDGDGGTEILFSLLGAYSLLDAPAAFKGVQHIRPQFFGKVDPAFNVQARYDFDIAEIAAQAPSTPANTALWDTALWDTAKWIGALSGFDSIRGATGRGRWVAVAMNGSTVDRQTLIAWDVLWTVEGEF